MKKSEYWIRKPTDKRRRSFSLHCRTVSGKTYTVKDERILTINSLYQAGTQDEVTCLRQLTAIKDEYTGKSDQPVYLDANLDIFHKYWDRVYKDRPSEEGSKRSRYNTFKRALAALGSNDLATTERATFQQVLRGIKKSQAWVYAGCYNAILKFIHRDVVVLAPSRPKPIPRHLTLEQIIKVTALLPKEWELLVWVAFGTGCRFGELFALEKYWDGVVKVEWQRTADWERKEPKNKVIRDVPVISQARSPLTEWLTFDSEIKKAMRKAAQGSKIMRRACAAAGVTEVTIHDLRHSYAIHLLGLGVSLTDVARALGDGMAVVQMYYTGFAMTDAQALRLAQGI